MRGVQVAVPQADGYCLHSLIQKLFNALSYLILIERNSLLAKHIYPSGDTFNQPAGHQRCSVPMGHMVENVLIGVASPGLFAPFMKENILVSPLGDNPYFLTGLREKHIQRSGAGVNDGLNSGEDGFGSLMKISAPILKRINQRLIKT